MIGIDTNILLRLILADDPKQAMAVRNFIHEHCSADDPGFVSHIVLVELAWTLARIYGYTGEQISASLEQILETSQLDVESSTDVAAALRSYRDGAAGFADCLLGRANLTAGCETTVTFDRKAAKLPGFKLLAVR